MKNRYYDVDVIRSILREKRGETIHEDDLEDIIEQAEIK